MSSKKKTSKGKTAKTKRAAKTARAPRLAKEFQVEATAAGKKEDIRMNAESIRTKLLASIKKSDSIGIDKLEAKFPDLTRANIVGAVRYLAAKGYVRIT